MAKAYTNVNSTTGTFAGWLSKSNELFYDMSTMIVTVADVTAPNSSNEARTTGNADIQGIFSANNIVVWDTLAGGRNEEWANTDTLYIVSNTQIGNSSQTDTLTVYGDATFDANVQIGSAATDGLTIAANTVVNGLSFFTANTRFNDNARISFGTDSDTSLYHDGSDLKLIHNNANTSDFIIEDVSGNDVFTFTTDHSTFTVARYDGVTTGPTITLKDVAPSANGQHTGRIAFQAADSGGNNTEYARIMGVIEDSVDGTEDGSLYLQTTVAGTNRSLITVNDNGTGEIRLYHANSSSSAVKLTTKTGGVLITGELQSDSLDVDGVADISGIVTLGANANFGDADQANFGAAADLQIFHDATDSHIKDNGTGNLKISSSQIDFLGGADGAETMATMVDDGAVTLYHNNAVKIATTATGVVVTGDTGTDTLTVGGGYGSTGLAIAATGNIQTNGTLTVDGLATLNAGIAVDTNKFTVADTSGNVSTAGTLDVTGISTLGIINASGLASLDGGIDVDGAFTVTNTSGNIATSGTLGVTGISTLGVINASGLASLDAGIDVDGAFTVADTTGNVVTSGTLGVTGVSTLGIINASGLASLNGGIAVDANFTVNGTSGATVIGSTLNVTGTSTLVAINSSGLASLDGGINVNDDFTVDADGNIVAVAATFSGLTSADGGIDVNSAKFTVAAAGDTVIAATTASTSSTTGALKVAGGTGIAGKLFVGDDVDITGDLVVDGTASFAGSGNLTVNNSVITTLSVVGDTDIGNGTGDTVTITARVDSDIVPSTDSARDLGTDALRWTHVYADNVHGIGTTLTALNASNIASGTIADARLPATISSDITGNAATVTNGVYLNTTQTISGAKTFSATTDFNGAVTLDGATTSSSSFTVDGGYVKLNDNINLNLGTDADAEIYHTGSHLYADINTGSFFIRDGADSNATRFTFTPSSAALEIKNTDASAAGPTITLRHDTASPAASDEAGQIFFQSDNDAAENVTYARIDALIADVSDGSEDGSLKLKVYQGGTLRDHITAESGVATLYHNGSAKLATASGGVTITGTATATTFSGSGASLTALPAASLTGNIASARLTSVPAASLTGNIDDARLPASITSDITGTAAKVTVTDSTTNTNFPVVFHNESNGLLDDTGALRYNPSTGTLLVPNLVVAGTTTTVDTVTMNAENAIVFEGATPDDYETTLTITDPTADRTITLPNATGTVALTSSDITGNAATATTLATARNIGGVSFNGSANIDLPGVNTAGNQNTSGTAAVATTVTITDNESTDEDNAIVFTAGGDVDGGNLGLESDGTLTYNPSTGKITATGFVGALTGDVTGNAATATKLATTRAIQVSGAVTGTANFDGSGAINIATTATSDPTITLGGDLTGNATLTNLGNATLTATIAATSVETGMIADDAVTGAKIADDAINSEHYTDGSIDTAHIAADAVTGAKIADDTINSEHYVAGSVDAEHLNVTGNGTTSQFLRSDGDGSFTWAVPAGVTAITVNTTTASGDILPIRDVALSGSISGGTLTLTLAKTLTVDDPGGP
jgi:hypothetical protein